MNDSHGQKTRFTLKACRVNKGFTIKEAAKKLGISEFTLMNYELGKTFPTVPVINKIEELYDVSYNDIIFLPQNNSLNVKDGRKRGERNGIQI